MSEKPASARRLEAVFARIQSERMTGVPILNPRLEVEAAAQRDWNGHSLSVLITPWFINLMLLPETEEGVAAFAALKPGANVLHKFPAGRFEFIVGEEGELGRYQMCSLFSPVLEFEDQEAARTAAVAALDALFDATLDPAASESRSGEVPRNAEGSGAPGASPRPSRRGLLTGRIGPGGEAA